MKVEGRGRENFNIEEETKREINNIFNLDIHMRERGLKHNVI